MESREGRAAIASIGRAFRQIRGMRDIFECGYILDAAKHGLHGTIGKGGAGSIGDVLEAL